MFFELTVEVSIVFHIIYSVCVCVQCVCVCDYVIV